MTSPLSNKTIQSLQGLAAENAGKRIGRCSLGGRTVRIKRYDVADHWAKTHRLVGMPLPAHMRLNPARTPLEAVQRSLRKSDRFTGAGFAAPAILYRDDVLVVLADVGETLEMKLAALRNEGDHAGHATLLCQCAEALARVHQAGLCHGRPHPRDFFIEDGEIGFLDFDEEPEAVMPLKVAQARDFWLLSLQIADLALDRETAHDIVRRYRKLAPEKTVTALDELARFWHPLIGAISWVRHLKEGADLRRIIKADRLLSGRL